MEKTFGSNTKLLIILALVASVFIENILQLPHGPAVKVEKEDQVVYLPIDKQNTSLRDPTKLRKIVERDTHIVKGPETVIFDNDGILYILTEEANLVRLDDFKTDENDDMVITARATTVADLGVGRPLGGKFAKDGSLFVADALMGLIRVRFSKNKPALVELVASRTSATDENPVPTQILYADDVDIGPKTGHVYFSDASTVAPERIGTHSWDTLQASKIHFMKGLKSGRLLRYNPSTNVVDELARDIHFANGVAVNADETFVLVSETFSARVLKYHLVGEKRGELEVVLGALPSLPDGADCSFSTGLCYVPIPTRPIALVHLLNTLPSILDQYLRTILMTLPRWLQPSVVPYGGVVEFSVTDSGGNILRVLQDPSGDTIRMLTGVTVFDGKVYLGSLENEYVGVYDLN